MTPQDGLFMAMDKEVAEDILEHLRRFTRRRPIRRANDLSRPMRD